MALRAEAGGGAESDDDGDLETGEEAHESSASPTATPALSFKGKPLEAFGEPSSGVDRSEDAPLCPVCGGIMIRSGTCYACVQCGTTSGCS